MPDILLESLEAQASAHEAHQRGFKAATDCYRVVFPCEGCRKGIAVDDGDREAFVVKAMAAARIGDKECVQGLGDGPVPLQARGRLGTLPFTSVARGIAR